MAPLSILPGRVRFETETLIGNERGCRYLEEQLMSLSGVMEVSVNHRTGRILVVFDENRIDVNIIKNHSCDVQKQIEAGSFEVTAASTSAKKNVSAGGVRQALFEAIAHAVLPMPLNILVPAAMHTLNK